MKGILCFTLMCVLACATTKGQTGEGGGSKVENVHFETSGKQIFIHYDLLGPDDEEYNVIVLLKRDSDPSFEYHPVRVSGDVGTGPFAGPGKTVIWNLTEEFPNGLEGEDFFFVVGARQVDSGTPMYVWVGAGALAIGGVVTYFILNQGDSPGGDTNGFPDPPGRP